MHGRVRHRLERVKYPMSGGSNGRPAGFVGGKANRGDIGAGRAQTCRHGSLQGEEEKRYTKIETEKTRGNRSGNGDAERMGWRGDEVNEKRLDREAQEERLGDLYRIA